MGFTIRMNSREKEAIADFSGVCAFGVNFVSLLLFSFGGVVRIYKYAVTFKGTALHFAQ